MAASGRWQAMVGASLLLASGAAWGDPPPASPSREPARSTSPSPPDAATFESVLLDLAHPSASPRDELALSDPGLAIRAQALPLMPEPTHDRKILSVLTQPALSAHLSDIPEGDHLGWLVGSPTGSDLQVKDMGKALLGSEGPFQRTLRAALGPGEGSALLAGAAATGAAFAAAGRWGTNPIRAAGLTPGLRQSAFDGRDSAGLGLQCDSGFKHPALNLDNRVELIRPSSTFRAPADLALEGGVTASKDARGLSDRWAKLRSRTTDLQGFSFDAAAGADQALGAPVTWLADGGVRRGPWRLHLAMSHQVRTDQGSEMSALSFNLGPVSIGGFGGAQVGVGMVVGSLVMGAF